MKIRVAFHKPKTWDILGQGIRFWTWLVSSKNRTVGPYDHVELWTGCTEGSFSYSDHIGHGFVGTCWTSTMRGDNNGTVKRPAFEVIHNLARWDIYEKEITDAEYETLIGWMEYEVACNKGYGILDFSKFFGLGWLIIDKLRNICSEFVNNALWRIGKLKKFGVVSPRRLAYLLEQSGWEKIDRKAA